VAFSEIEPFPCAVLAHHYPDVPNLGDVTKITEEQIAALGLVDVVVGGSPCTDLSIAGRREGLAGKHSSLFYDQLRIFNAAYRYCGARFLLWENVPGAFSSNKGRDFAQVVAAMAGCGDFRKGSNGGKEGAAVGANGLVEWSVLDAQWFGLAQRRKRVFAVLDTGAWPSRPPILLERDSLRGDSPPCRTSETQNSTPIGVSFESADAIAKCLNAGGTGRLDFTAETLVYTCKTTNTKSKGLGISSDGIAYTLDTAGVQAVSIHSTQNLDVQVDASVRRLTPRECERLQGFPDGYTRIPYRNKPPDKCPDGPRYKALGNSMAVPVMRWIGKQIQRATLWNEELA